MSLMENPKKVKETLNENENFFQENHSEKLFGGKFDKHIVDRLKLKKRSKEFFYAVDEHSSHQLGVNEGLLKRAPYFSNMEVGGEATTISSPKDKEPGVSQLIQNMIPILSPETLSKIYRLVKKYISNESKQKPSSC